MITVEIAGPYSTFIQPDLLQQAAAACLEDQSALEDAGLTIRVSSDQEIQELNSRYRGIDASTDVLSFPAEFTDPDDRTTYLGDIIISYPRAQYQAEQAGHSPEAELQLLVVHGLLHLLGFDHADPVQKDAMWTAQQAVLTRLGLPDLKIADGS